MTACVVIFAVIILRIPTAKASKGLAYILWAAVFFRLLCPFEITLPNAGVQPVTVEQVESDIIQHNAPTAVNIADRRGGNIVIYTSESAAAPEYKFMGTALKLGTAVWFTGMTVMALYGVWEYIKLKRSLKKAADCGGYYTCTNIGSPFILGIFKPKIYLPDGLSERERELILLHERSHISRGDHIAKIIMYTALCVHWFNPLVWLSFRLCERDMEIYCDSRAASKMDSTERADYSQALLNTASVKAASFTACFGESNIKKRVKNVLKYKKPALWIIIICTVLIGAAVIFLSVNRRSDTAKNVFDAANINGNALSGFAISAGDTISEAFFITDEKTPPAATEFSEKFGALKLGTGRNDSILDENKTTYTVRIPLVTYELSSDGKNAELYVRAYDGSVAYYEIFVMDYNTLTELAEELLEYKTPVTYDDSAIKSILSEEPAAVGVSGSTVYKMQLTKEARDRLMGLLRECEYTPLPDDFKIVNENAIIELFPEYFGDSAPTVLGLVKGTGNHSTESYYAVSIYNSIYNYSIDKELYEAIYEITYRGENYIYD